MSLTDPEAARHRVIDSIVPAIEHVVLSAPYTAYELFFFLVKQN